ncbi:hypothetical protein RN001_012283 [Aquatica leii]|uniref:Tyr recombinase domain-containing protein n=1 Tax=Aquatica leii TaxID=1421715 RepID=A0AAN7P5Y6_9COLE|nr:hypothetical protein RN001_012283 [Aquatica leii]
MSLYRHTKKCSQNIEVNKQKRQTAQSDGQTALLLGTRLKHDQLLKTELFPRMRADDISLIAKKDPLICQYAYSYIKGRRSKGNLDLVRQNVRRLAKLFKFVQKQDCNIKLLIDLLRPCYFKMIIDGVNDMARYNHETEKYESPTLAMNFGTLLKKCCDLAFVELLQIPNTEKQREDVNILKNLIISQWADEVSAQAGTNLNENQWNKEQLLPLTTDLKKLNDYLCNSAEQHYNTLKNNNDANAYYALKDILYTQIMLLNRRRPAEVAQLKLHTYKAINLDTSKQDTEFENCLTKTEKILLNTYSRFVIRGKRGRGVPVLLSPIMRKHFDFVITVRDQFVQGNDYIFHTKGKGFIDGTKTLHKYVEKCGVTRAKSITATLLRKHLATITQLLHFSNNDMEQLSKFMGHTLKTHCNVYRMSDNIYQTAKVSKLLLLMMEGGAENFKGKQLEEIDIPLTPVIDNQDVFTQCVQDTPQSDEEVQKVDDKSISHGTEENREKVNKLIERLPWTDQQKQIIFKHFAENIKKKEAPKQLEVKKLIEIYPELFKERKWTSIKAVVYNMYTGKLKIK